MLYDWVRIQDLADASSSRRLTLGRQVFATFTSIQGSASYLLEQISNMVHGDMTRDEFKEVIDRILEVLDPIDRELSFLETAKACEDPMRKFHGARQTYDSYWSEYSSLCVHYVYSHGKVAQSRGVQELTALLCVLNARLDKTEFAMVLQSAMQYHATLKSRPEKSSIQKRQESIVSGPRSAKEVLGQCSNRPDGVGCEITSKSDAQAEDSTDVVQDRLDIDARISEMKIEISDAKRPMDTMQKALRDIQDEFPDEMEKTVSAKLKAGWILLDANQGSRNKCGKIISEINQIRQDSATQKTVVVEKTPVEGESYDPIITMEAVRVEIRLPYFGEKALEDRTGINANTNDTTTSKITDTKKIQCWECGGPHRA